MEKSKAELLSRIIAENTQDEAFINSLYFFARGYLDNKKCAKGAATPQKRKSK